MKTYKIILSKETINKVENYLNQIKINLAIVGDYLKKSLKNFNSDELSEEILLDALINTKLPQIFAESSVIGNGKDWNLTELSILGDIGVAVNVEIYDNGHHNSPKLYKSAKNGTLLFIPGALLRNDRGYKPADWDEIIVNDKISKERYYKLYERRLVPLFMYANEKSK